MKFDPKTAFSDPADERRRGGVSCASCGESERIEVRRHYDTLLRACRRCGLEWQAGLGVSAGRGHVEPDAEELTERAHFLGAPHRRIGPDIDPEE